MQKSRDVYVYMLVNIAWSWNASLINFKKNSFILFYCIINNLLTVKMGGQGGIKFLDYSKKKNYKYEKQAVLNKSYFKFFNFKFYNHLDWQM